MKHLAQILACLLITGCGNRDIRLIEADEFAITEIAAKAIMRERPHLASEDLSLLRFNYTFLNRRNYPLKESAWDNPDFAEGLEVTLLLKPTATVVKWTSDGNEVIAYWHQ